jgi:hypothetical protein
MTNLLIAIYLFVGIDWGLCMAEGTWKSLWLNIAFWPYYLMKFLVCYYLVKPNSDKKEIQ